MEKEWEFLTIPSLQLFNPIKGPSPPPPILELEILLPYLFLTARKELNFGTAYMELADSILKIKICIV